ncbi:MAG: dimethyl sulfoxide reductase anchor subunit [Proteobacteria bacterium]|nr:dimethyl sulfoxide reductase anchor subunit [Pseudomonadota bacterium]
MNPAFSVVFLTTAAGAGYGMLAWLGVLDAVGVLPRSGWFGGSAVATALVLAAAGLLASTLHLGHPERAWRALSQWRTSWLSREGVVSLVTFVPAGGFGLAWALAGGAAPVTVVLGLLAAVCGLATVASQAMIYASLKPIRQWHHQAVLPNFLLLALYSGAICVAALVVWVEPTAERTAGGVALLAGALALAGKLGYWRAIDTAPAAATIESATGLGFLGKVRSLELPHTEENYLLREMGFVIGRRHAHRLRQIAIWLGFAGPMVLLVVGVVADALGGGGEVLLPLAALGALVGIYLERWLFFAEATHTVTLYYGRAA